MKLRLKGNTIRFRLQQSDLTQLIETGRVTESCVIGPLEVLSYELYLAEESTAGFLGNILSIGIEKKQGLEWAGSDENGIAITLNNNSENGLRIYIEKDYACLTSRANEDDSDAFPNPNKSC